MLSVFVLAIKRKGEAWRAGKVWKSWQRSSLGRNWCLSLNAHSLLPISEGNEGSGARPSEVSHHSIALSPQGGDVPARIPKGLDCRLAITIKQPLCGMSPHFHSASSLVSITLCWHPTVCIWVMQHSCLEWRPRVCLLWRVNQIVRQWRACVFSPTAPHPTPFHSTHSSDFFPFRLWESARSLFPFHTWLRWIWLGRPDVTPNPYQRKIIN